jgi:hypothetical protein
VLPLVVAETLVSPFKFWNEGVYCGMLYRNDFYRSLRQFPAADRLQAFTQAIEESNRGYKVCITASSERYTVWVEMRSPRASASAPASAATLPSGSY